MSPRYPIPERKDAHARSTSNVVPHPRHCAQRLYDAQSPTSRASHPVYNDYELHLVDDDDLHHNLDDTRSRTRGANVTPIDRTPSAVDGGLPIGDRQSHPRVLGQVRRTNGRLGDRDRLARVELPTGRGEPDGLLLHLPARTAIARRSVRGGRLPGLAGRTVRRTSIGGRGRVAVCVVGGIALATLIWVVR